MLLVVDGIAVVVSEPDVIGTVERIVRGGSAGSCCWPPDDVRDFDDDRRGSFTIISG